MEKVVTVDCVGEAVEDREEVRCIGLRATGGAAFLELVVDVESRRSEVGGGSNVVLIPDEVSFREV